MDRFEEWVFRFVLVMACVASVVGVAMFVAIFLLAIRVIK